MTIEEIFIKLASHMKEGTEYHEKMAQAYNFIGLHGNAMCQFSHHKEEFKEFQCLLHYYTLHYHKLLKLENTSPAEIIPESWYKYTTMAVDGSTKKNALRDLMNKWIEWERSTKKFYQEMQQELTSINEIAAALYIDQLILDVEKELCHAEKKLIRLESIGYDAAEVLELDKEMEKKYKKKLGW